MIVVAMWPPARATVWRRNDGSGLATPKVSAPQIAANRCESFRRSSSSFDSHSSLLVQTAKAAPCRREIVERRLQPLERARQVGDMVGVIGDEILHHPVDLGDRAVAVLRLQPALDQLARAAADQVACGRERQLGNSFLAQDDVERGDQVGRGVDEGAVEIENNERSGWPCLFATCRAAPAQVAATAPHAIWPL